MKKMLGGAQRMIALASVATLVACGAAEPEMEAAPGENSGDVPAPEMADGDIASYTATIEEGHTITWREVGPGLVIAAEANELGDPLLATIDEPKSVRELFALALPGEEMPQELRDIADREEAFASLTEEQRTTLLQEFLADNGIDKSAPEEPLTEGKPDLAASESFSHLSLASTPTTDTGDDSKYTKSRFIENTHCMGGEADPEIRHTRRTGDDDATITGLRTGSVSAASYRGKIQLRVRARVDYGLFWGGWDVWEYDVKEGTRKGLGIQAPGTVKIQVNTQIRNADGDGWHHCLQRYS